MLFTATYLFFAYTIYLTLKIIIISTIFFLVCITYLLILLHIIHTYTHTHTHTHIHVPSLPLALYFLKLYSLSYIPHTLIFVHSLLTFFLFLRSLLHFLTFPLSSATLPLSPFFPNTTPIISSRFPHPTIFPYMFPCFFYLPIHPTYPILFFFPIPSSPHFF